MATRVGKVQKDTGKVFNLQVMSFQTIFIHSHKVNIFRNISERMNNDVEIL
ncbi:hypothetical protein RCZ01_12130 [Capnocytophaga felis]|uniref:Uncharacterized protein n=1 Tax=Capnocytophaga felis TaxID=2267611 RepID=A0A5M4B8I9_9FLAO|nr:hypothetical protein RCZ01_12130 [Capnocytophaga felis]